MKSVIRQIARLGSHARRRQVALGSLALVIALVLLGLPVFADTPEGTQSPCPVPVASAEPALHELIAAPIIDTYIDEYDGVKDTDHSNDQKLRLRHAENGEADILLKFDLAGIPENAIIQSVDLEMQVVNARPALSADNAPGVALYRPFKPWCADADWTRYCDSSTWCLPGASGIEGSCAGSPDRGPEHVNAQFTIDGTRFLLKVQAAGIDTLGQWVQAWVSGAIPNDGLLLELADPVRDVQQIDIAGSGYFGFPEASAPVLKVVWKLEPVPGDIGGKVWLDKNANGIREVQLGETPAEGIAVTLYKSDGSTVDSVVTNKCGEYVFSRVAPDQYYLRFEALEGYSFSPKDMGTDDTLDSDVDPATGLTDEFALPEGGTLMSWDAGLYAKGLILYFPIMGNRAKYWP